MSGEDRLDGDETLLRRALDGDEAGFTQLYRHRQGAIYRFALHMAGDAALAEDVVQDTFLALLENGRRFDAERGSLAGFLYGIARNLVLRRLERRDGQASGIEGMAEALASGDDVLDDLTRREAIEQV